MGIRRSDSLQQKRARLDKGAPPPPKAQPIEQQALREIANGNGTLKFGDTGPAVEEMQAALGLPQTGVFDEEMRASVEGFRRATGLGPGGEIDADTLYGLNAAFREVKPEIEKLLGTEQRHALADLDEVVDEGSGLNAHKSVIFAEEIALSVATLRNAVEAWSKSGSAMKGAATLGKLGDLVGVVLLPATAYYAAKDVRAAVRASKDGDQGAVHQERKKDAVNRAAGSVGYFTSVAAGTAKEVARASSSGFLGRLVPGLSVLVAAGDITWATTVCRDKEASKKKKAAACASAVGSVISMVTPPPISWAASAVATGGLLASNFL